MKKVINLYKPVSYTPLQVVEAFVEEFPKYKGVKLGYAGRLDPMASGVLLVLVGGENRRRKQYEKLSKKYEFEVLFGVATDTYDVMGKIVRSETVGIEKEDVEDCLKIFLGRWKQEYPPYSSALVRGKPLFWWARKGRISEIEIPSKMVRVNKIRIMGWKTVAGRRIARNSIARIQKVRGEFRQKEIISGWRRFAEKCGDEEFCVGVLEVECSSGVYVRGIANEIGVRLGVGSVAYSIKRVSVGEYNLSSSQRLVSID